MEMEKQSLQRFFGSLLRREATPLEVLVFHCGVRVLEIGFCLPQPVGRPVCHGSF